VWSEARESTGVLGCARRRGALESRDSPITERECEKPEVNGEEVFETVAVACT
jgi:hypothetical protein